MPGGKNSAKTGRSSVPSPKPEKKVNADAENATVHMITYDMIQKESLKRDGVSNEISGVGAGVV
jgi:hypothetical protein